MLNYNPWFIHVLWALSHTNEWITTPRIVLKFDTNSSSSWWRFWTSRGVPLSWNWTLWTWYYNIFLNFCTLVILLQVNLTSNDEPKTIWESFYGSLNTSIFAWSSIPDIGHYRWLCDPIRWLPLNSKAKYLICTIWHIDFL